MIVRPDRVRALLRERAGEIQVSASAVLELASALEGDAASFAEESARVLRERNEARAVQRLEPLRRLTDEHVREALRRSDANR